MDNRRYKPRNFGFSQEVKGYRSQRIYPSDDDYDATSLHSIVQNSPVNAEMSSNERLFQTDENYPNQNRISFNDKKLKSSTISIRRLLITGGILFSISLLTILPTVLGIILTRNPSVTNATTTSTVASIVDTAYWSFDMNANDLYGIYDGVLINGATYSNSTYFGYGSCLALNASINQSVIISSPFFNLSYTSFTIEAWIYAITVGGNNGIFDQCYCNSCQDQCLFLMLLNSKLYMGFTLDDLMGITSLSINTWYHVAFVYDYTAQTQWIYLQGVLENSKTSAGPYQGQNASIIIGSSHLSSSSFNGYIDNMIVTTRAKSASEILSDATVVVYFSFDGTSLANDMGPNKLNGTISNAAAVTGKIGQGLAFTGSVSSYLQIYGFYELGQSNKPFSFALWIYPYSINGGVLIQVSTYSNSTGWCYSFIGLNYLGQIAMTIATSYDPVIMGPILPVRTWIHLGYTYSTTNGIRMYINGTLYATTGAVSFGSSGAIDWLSIGSYVVSYCGIGSGAIYAIPYQGAIDEFYVYRRELNSSEVFSLANP